MFRVVLVDGGEEKVRSYQREDGRVRLVRADGSVREIEEQAIDYPGTFAANLGVEFAPPPPDPEVPALELLEEHEETVGDYLVVHGRVRNVATFDLANVVARVVAEDGAGALAAADEALVDWSPIPAGGDTPFRVVVRAPGKVARTRLEFRVLLGERLRTRGLDA